jgi:hypothetical protein
MHVDQPTVPYEAKYGWNRQSLRITGLALVFCAAALLPTMPLWVKILDLALFGGSAVLMAIISLRGTIAIRVDQAGITLCSSPVYPKSTTRLFPWEDVVSVVIWQTVVPGQKSTLDCVGVERRSGVPPVTGKFTGRPSRSAARLESPGITPEMAVTRAVANGWVLDRDRLTAAIVHFAPGVSVVDTKASSRPGGHQAQE